MTDQELIKAIKNCENTTCYQCPVHNEYNSCFWAVCDRFEALLADNAALDREAQIQICKRSDVEREIGRLEAERDHFRDLTKKLWCEKQYAQWVSVDERLPETEDCVLVTVNGKIGSREYIGGYLLAEYVPGEGWILEEFPQWENPDVTFWCYLPEPPRTEV